MSNRIVITAAALAITIATHAQPSAWTLENCIKQAIANNIDLKQRIQELEQRDIEKNTAQNSWLPAINAGIGQNFDFGRSPSKDGVILDRTSANTSASLQLNMPLFDGFRTPNDIAARKLNLAAASESLAKAKDDLAVGVASYYLQALYNKEILAIAELQKTLVASQVAKTEALVNAGKVPLSQLYDIKAQAAKDEVTLTDARNNVKLALLNLAQLLELERTGADFDIITPELKADMPDNTSITPPEAIYESALIIKPQIKEQDLLLESRKKSLKVAQSAYYPQLNLNMSYSNGYYHYSGTDVLNVNFGDQLKQNERKTIGMSLNIPIFNRYQTRNNVRSARAAIITQELLAENAKKTLYKEIQQAYFNAASAREKHASAARSVEAAKEAFSYAEERYATGKSTVFEYNESKTKYAQSLSEQAQAKFDYIFRKKILDFYGGIPFSL
ncbi:MAG: TolC family protein [Tannerellaceae bacterium]|jgi:outer membrane protein|nr:TolC family protein [Tannerellaceae bacterium]